MKKTYMQPRIWVEKLDTESQLLATSKKQVTNVVGLGYGGGGSGPARAGENDLWDEEEDDDTAWDQL